MPLLDDPAAYHAKLLQMEAWAVSHELTPDQTKKLKLKRQTWAMYQAWVYWRGARHHFPHIVVSREEDGACTAWAQGWEAWKNRCRLASGQELSQALHALKQLE